MAGSVEAVQAAAARLLALGRFWGDDQPGQEFGRFYQPRQDVMLRELGLAAGGVEGIAAGIRDMADRYGVTEAAIVHDVQRAGEDGQP